jgi:poly(A) polymerase
MLKIPSHIRNICNEIAEKYVEAGNDLYLVGGYLRDLYLGDVTGNELDFTTDATPQKTYEILSTWADNTFAQGKAYGTIGAIKHGIRIEITTFRKEVYIPESRKPKVTFGKDLREDLLRRDFTINTLVMKFPEEKFIDHFNAISDIENKVLRTPIEPDISFSDDPLRMLRAARFVAKYNMNPDSELIKSIKSLKERIKIVSKERVRDEFDKIMLVEKPSLGLSYLIDTGLMELIIPEIPALSLTQDPVHRHKDVLKHTLAVVDKTSCDKILRLAALFHDIGKPATRKITESGVSFYHHDAVGARMTRKRMRQMAYPNNEIDAVSKLVELHLRFHTYSLGWTDKAVRRYVVDAGDLLERLNELTRCDCTTQNAQKAALLNQRMDELEQRLMELKEKEELKNIKPEIDGNRVMELLKLKPSRDVGLAMDFLLELRINEGILGQDEVERRLVSWWASRQ